MTDFLLSKWYFDFLDEQGRGIVGYQAMLTWGKLKLGYHGSINFYNSPPVDNNKFTTKDFSQNRYLQVIEFKTDHVKGTWTPVDNPYEYELFNSDSGKIHWHCVQPKSNVVLETNAEQLKGYGYAEKIELTLPPWKIPIKELIWGRYHSTTNTIVWIKWTGPVPKTLVFFNGQRVDALISETGISFGRYQLSICNTNIIRQNTVGESVFKYFATIMRYFPTSIMTLHETKWCAEGILSSGPARVDTGTVIHELVKWP